MRFLDAFFVKDRVVKEAIYNSMSEDEQQRYKPIVEKAFYLGTQKWLDEWLPAIFGEQEAQDLKDRLEEDLPGLLRRMRGESLPPG